MGSKVVRDLPSVPRSTLLWRWGRNFNRSLRQSLDKSADSQVLTDVKMLRTEGIIVRPAEEVFSEQGVELLDQIIPLSEERLKDDKNRISPYNDAAAEAKISSSTICHRRWT